jgi:hypothetical protein
MATLFNILSILCSLAALVSGIFILIAAFKDEVWKGLLCILCQIYLLYYVITEWDNLFFNDIPIGIVYIVSVALSFGFQYLAHTLH